MLTLSIFLTRSLCLCSSVWKVWPLPIFLIFVLVLHCTGSFWFEIHSLRWSCCAGTQDRVGVKVFWCGWSENVGINCQLDSEICPLVLRLLLDTWKHTCSELVFLLGMHFWVCITFYRVLHNVRLIIIIDNNCDDVVKNNYNDVVIVIVIWHLLLSQKVANKRIVLWGSAPYKMNRGPLQCTYVLYKMQPIGKKQLQWCGKKQLQWCGKNNWDEW